ncbi:iron/ascorbate-dependent oxidoreductase family protein [Pleurotus pulmonarius]|nr:hypothetical protein EYR38_002397 [Pleurotus pulmonarius]
MNNQIPVIDISAILSPSKVDAGETQTSPETLQAAQNLYDAFSTWGFCLLKGTGIPASQRQDLFRTAAEFFALPEEKKLELHVRTGGVAWRGYMPHGGEATHGHLDHKVGMYFGPEHPDDHPHAGLPLHGKNRFPDDSVPAMRPAVLTWIDQITNLGKALSDAISLSLGLERPYMREKYLAPEPVAIVRCFKYTAPKTPSAGQQAWGIGEHTDFGYLTLLTTDAPGLQVKSPSGDWIDVPLNDDYIICNVGDMLDQMTGGRFISTPHRVVPPPQGTSRISVPFFFDFSWDAKMEHLPLDHLPALTPEEQAVAKARWEQTTFTGVSGVWAQYLAKKVKKVFPDLQLPDFEHNAKPSTRFNVAVDTSVNA